VTDSGIAPDTEIPTRPEDTHTPTADDHVPGSRRVSARKAVAGLFLALALIVVCDGDGIRRQGEKLKPGFERDVVLAIGHPAGWIADQLPFADAVDAMTGWLSPDEDLGNRSDTFTADGGSGGGRVGPQAFTPAQLGLRAGAKPALQRVLVTGDSLSQPLDSRLARALADDGVTTKRDPKLGTGISHTDLLDWGRYSAIQARRDRADAVVVFLGAGEGFPMKSGSATLQCCDVRWAAEYSTRVRTMMSTYLRAGADHVYWLLLPTARDGARNKIIRVVNQAIRVAAGAYGAAVRLVDIPGILTPGGRYRDAMTVDGREQIVRDPDGVHLNGTGAELAAAAVQRALNGDFK
jgi:lysophospholipase L1-like esterase